MDWSGKCLLMGHRISEEDNNAKQAVDEEDPDQGEQAGVKVEEEQEDSEGSEEEEMAVGGSNLTRGVKFSSAGDFDSFLGEDKSEVEVDLQLSAVEINNGE